MTKTIYLEPLKSFLGHSILHYSERFRLLSSRSYRDMYGYVFDKPSL